MSATTIFRRNFLILSRFDKDLSTQLAEELTYYEKEKDTIATSSTSTKDDVKNGKEIPSIMTKSISVSFNNFNWEERKVGKSTIPPATIIPEEDKDEEDLIDSSDEEFEEQSPEKTLRCAITIEKKDKGVLAFEALAREGRFLIENVSFYEALQTNHTKSAIPFPNLSAN
ncbi:21136_t:CDS:2 [Rhizophagus irregularis]|nr:21136_t:CDS:2 [Rhizophagus irregularis]